ncbi:MAG: thymidine phosphorylase [Spirochaetota bacterium]
MNTCEIIINKRDGKAHSEQELDYLISGFTRGTIPDYQVSAWLMACFLNGLNEEETYFLTRAIINSGSPFNLHFIKKPKVDKHSTGGVGDKVSLVLAPAAASCGVAVPMTSGRGLGHTGGTLDKLESIPGYNVNLNQEQFISILEKVGFVMAGQTPNLAPADRKLYQLRDVSGTVESIPLITSSILGKKAAEGAEGVVIDVKFGSGAFMETKAMAKKLATWLFHTADKLEIKLVCVLSSMDQPLGMAVGNSLEVAEALECMKGNGPEDVKELTGVLGGYMLRASGIACSMEEGKEKILQELDSGGAFGRFVQSVEAQGGDIAVIKDTSKLPQAENSREVLSGNTGYVHSINTRDIGTACVYLGGGRFTAEESIDHAAGLLVNKKIGDSVKKGESIATLKYNKQQGVCEAVKMIKSAYYIKDHHPEPFQLVHEVIQ